MLKLAARIEETAAVVRKQWSKRPIAGILLGSGLGGLAGQLDCQLAIHYDSLPHFKRTLGLGHRPRLVCGTLDGAPVIAFQGRFHLYEGHSAQRTTLPVRLMKELGAGAMVVTNAVGGLNPHFEKGDVLVIDDQINLLFDNPLIGVNDDQLGPRFPDMCAPYDRPLIEVAHQVARRENFTLHQGVYAAMLGPTYETRAEYRMARRLGADVVGMSTVGEVIVARHADMRVLGLSVITNVASSDAPSVTTGHDVLVTAQRGGRSTRNNRTRRHPPFGSNQVRYSPEIMTQP